MPENTNIDERNPFEEDELLEKPSMPIPKEWLDTTLSKEMIENFKEHVKRVTEED